MWILTRYFLDNIFGRQLLDDEGIVALRRVLIFAASGMVAIALYVPRMLHKKFADLDALWIPEPYRLALVADSFLMICLILMLSAFMAALVAPAMFPTEVDFVTLTPLPLSRRRIFGAKVAAVLIFAGTVILAVVLFFAVSFPLFTQGRWAEETALARIASFAAATAAGAAFAFLAVMAAEGLVLTVLPRAWVSRASMILQSGAIAGLILTAPVMLNMASRHDWRHGVPAEWLFFPPTWFLGLDQFLLGRDEAWIAPLVRVGFGATASAAIVTLACYGWLYRRPERLASLPPKAPKTAGLARVAAPVVSAATRPGRGSAWTAVWVFLTSTLARNRLPQLVFLVAWAAGLAIVANDLQDGLGRMELVRWDADASLISAAVTMPFVLMLAPAAGLRAAFLLPVSLPANWMFRVTDFPAARAERLDAVEQAFIRLALLPALLLSAPVLVFALGLAHGLLALVLATLAGAVLLEWILTGWRRVPFTCTWLPGKRPLPFALLSLLVVIWVANNTAAAVTEAVTYSPRFAIVLAVLFTVTASVLRWRRTRSWALEPLEFEDEPFDRVQRLGLGPS